MPAPDIYDVFLSHNSQDKPTVRAVADWLRTNNVTVWLDEVELNPGDRLSDKLGAAIEQSRSAVVFLGQNGEGDWQREEVDTLLNKAIQLSRKKDEFRIIPVRLAEIDPSRLRWFLRTRLWVDLSRGVTDSQAELFRLRQAILGRASDSSEPNDPAFNPYKGLSAFQAGDAPFFFGRVTACRTLATKLNDWRFACIVGPSGNGKSSLARAGLATEAAESVCPGIGKWKRVNIAPGSNLIRAFLEQLQEGRPQHERADAVSSSLERVDPKERKASAEEMAEALNKEFSAWSPRPDEPVLFLVDQFEEVFTHRGIRALTETEREERIRRVLDCLALLLERGEKRWRFVLTLREDFYQRCRISPAFWEWVSADRLTLRLDELDEPGWREAIKGPAARAGAYLEAGLVEVMLKDAYRQRGSMPLLQLALQELWRSRQGACLTHAAYTTLGGVADALQRRAGNAFRLLEQEKPEYLEIARNLFLRLTSLGEGVSDTRRRIDRMVELDWENSDAKDIEHVISRLSDPDHRLLVADEHWLEVTHEVLIRESEHIRTWLDGVGGARKEIPTLRRLTHAASRWKQSSRNPAFLNASDPPQELQRWLRGTRLRLTQLEREYVKESQLQRAQERRTKCRQQQAVRVAERDRTLQAEKRLDEQAKARKKAVGYAILATALAIFAGVSWGNAKQERSFAQDALVNSFYRSIGVNNPLTRDEDEALWELTELRNEIRAARSELVLRWSASWEGLGRATSHDAMALRSSLGLHPQLGSAIAVARNFTELMDHPSNLSPEQLTILSHALERLDGLIPARDLAELAARSFEKSIQCLRNLPTQEQRAPELLAEPMLRFGKWLDPDLIVALSTNILDAIENTDHNAYDCILQLGRSIATMGCRMDPTTATTLATNVLESLSSTSPQDSLTLSALGQALAALGCNMKPELAATLATQGSQLLVNSLKYLTSSNVLFSESHVASRLQALREAIPTLISQIPPEAAAKIAVEAANCAVGALKYPNLQHGYTLDRLVELVEAFAAGTSNSEAAGLSEVLLDALENPSMNDGFQPPALGQALASLIRRLNPSQAAKIGSRLVQILGHPRETEWSRLWALQSAIEASGERLDEEQAGKFGLTLLKVLEREPGEDTTGPSRRFRMIEVLDGESSQKLEPAANNPRLIALGHSLAVFGSRMNATQASSLATHAAHKLAVALTEPKGDDLGTIQRLGEELSRLATLMNPEPSLELGLYLLQALEYQPEDGGNFVGTRINALAQALASLGDKTRLDSAAVLSSNLLRALEVTDPTSHSRQIALGSALAWTVQRMESERASTAAARAAPHLVRILKEISFRNSYNVSNTAKDLALLLHQTDASTNSEIAVQLIAVITNQNETDTDRLRAIGGVLVVSGRRLSTIPAESLGKSLVDALENPSDFDPHRHGVLGWVLAAVAKELPLTKELSAYGWSKSLVDPIPAHPQSGQPADSRRSDFVHWCKNLSTSDLFDVLKWPYCTGEAEQIVLTELEASDRLGTRFGGSFREFIRIADARPEWRPLLRSPAKQPKAPREFASTN